jgi:predicted peroxiredoxin
MSRLLIHLASGPEHPTRATLALLVGKTALDAGHDVDVVLVGDAVVLYRDATMDAVQGVGTGNLREHFDGLAAGGARFFASRMSSAARDVTDETVGGKVIEFIWPSRLVDLVFEADRVLSY